MDCAVFSYIIVGVRRRVFALGGFKNALNLPKMWTGMLKNRGLWGLGKLVIFLFICFISYLTPSQFSFLIFRGGKCVRAASLGMAHFRVLGVKNI